jgi:hypothetical protein
VVGLSLGAHGTDLGFAIKAEGNVGGIAGAAREERREITAPLPIVSASVAYEVAPRLRVAAKVDYLQLTIVEHKGRLTISRPASSAMSPAGSPSGRAIAVSNIG